MAREKLTPIFTSIVEYTLISSILDRICEMTTKPWEYLKDDTCLLPLQHLLEIITWGTKWKTKHMNGHMAMGKCKDGQKKSCITKTNCKYSKGGYIRLPLGDVYTCHGFLQKMHEFEKVDSITFFHKLTQQFINKGLGNLW